MGTGAYPGFRGDIMDDGNAMVWVEDGSRPAAQKLGGGAGLAGR